MVLHCVYYVVVYAAREAGCCGEVADLHSDHHGQVPLWTHNRQGNVSVRIQSPH